ncbi:MAG: tRNA 2-thiouridine(34) synthase MnmA [Deltaproteobacteria bacterium]|nr:tRNA 2-thiouridine(34) synthase MnmA [Deltaproteobacteria bacterium]
MKKALIAMSGGVDSSVAAMLMREQGYECIGVTMRLHENWNAGGSSGNTCCSVSDAEDAASVAARLGMPHYVFDYTEAFRIQVMDRFAQAYLAGRTPNPCIDCNRFLKFELLYERAKALGCETVVTGHYARILFNEKERRYELRKGLDAAKDQSYVLYMLTQEQLKSISFPLGEYTKARVRELAKCHGFINARKRDSQDICFVPDGRYADFIERYTGRRVPEGNFVDEEGRVLGRHKGIFHYTVGQRRGLGIPAAVPYYVKAIRADTNEVVLAQREAVRSLMLVVHSFNWVSIPKPDGELRAMARVRYRQEEKPAAVRCLAEDRVMVRFDEPQAAVAPGQALVLYAGDVVLGGGTIGKTCPACRFPQDTERSDHAFF